VIASTPNSAPRCWCMSIVVGAIMTPLMGWIADMGGMRIGFNYPVSASPYRRVRGNLEEASRRAMRGEAADEPVTVRPVH